VPAAAVIPAPRAYIKVAAVKKLVVGCRWAVAADPALCVVHHPAAFFLARIERLASPPGLEPRRCYFEETRVFKAGVPPLNTLAWNNGTGLWPVPLVCRTGVMMKRNSRGHLYFVVRGEILGFTKDKPLRKHLPRMFSLIKNESWGLEDD
jgi:hypothetical protein